MKRILIRANALCFALLTVFLVAFFLGINAQGTAYADTRESESNNTAATANTISVNTSISGNLSSSSDVDWYKFTVSSDGYFYVTFNHTVVHDSDTLWRIYFYDSTAVDQIDGNSSYFGVKGISNRTTSTFGISAGTYYIKITRGSSDDYSGVDYQLKVHYEVATDWETEYNNSAGYADRIHLYESINATISTNGDIDWFKLTANASTEIQITLNHEIINDSSTLWYVYVYDSTAVNKLTSFGSEGSTASWATDYISVTSGSTYYIKLTGKSTYYYSSVPYSLVVTDRHEHIGEWIESIEPTCTDSGTEMRTCSICDCIETRDVPEL